MEDLKNYINKTIGTSISIKPIQNSKLDKLPFYIRHSYNFYHVNLFEHHLLLLEVKDENNFKIGQTEKRLKLIQEYLHEELVLLIQNLNSLGRKRLIEKRINFIVPGKQLFLPSIMVDLRESFKSPVTGNGKLLPSAQLILFYKILKRNDPIEKYNLKEIAAKLDYTQMAITKTVHNLKLLGLATTKGTKDKYLKFENDIPELWNKAFPLMINPVFRKLYVDELPETARFFKSNESALPAYSDMAESRQAYYAVYKNLFYDMKKKEMFTYLNETEGHFCLEVWKYNPALLANDDHVDPLSLYMSLKGVDDERVEMALDQITKQYIW